MTPKSISSISPHPTFCTRTTVSQALRSGKAVLCEKPFAINAAEAGEVIRMAREKGLFAMEAMWTRFLPAIVRVRELLAAGAIGEPRWLCADFGFKAPFNPKSRIFDPALGGGALLDVGVYPVSLASMVFGPPKEISSRAVIGPTGVDEQDAIILSYDGGRLATLNACVTMTTPTEAIIAGEKGISESTPRSSGRAGSRWASTS